MDQADHEHTSALLRAERFADRHIGPDPGAQARMLKRLGYDSLDALIDAAVPAQIRQHRALALPEALTEPETLDALRRLADRNHVMTSMIGLGYHDTVTPAVIRRNVLESPAWYTAYTPYQPEISQGRLEALLNFQTVVTDLCGLPTANASLLDEATSAAEAMTIAHRVAPKTTAFVVHARCLPQTVDVVRTRAAALGIDVVLADLAGPGSLPDIDAAGVLLQYPCADGEVVDHEALIAEAHARGMLAVVAADLLGLVLLRPPGAIGADVVVGSSQRFGVPLGYGGPHAGFIAVRDGLQRLMPGRLVGVSVDANGRRAYRLALQTREQHIRRERATSNICTAQVLPAVLASMFAVSHGPDGLQRIAERVHRHAVVLAEGLRRGGVEVVHDAFFDTVAARVPDAAAVVAAARGRGVNLRQDDRRTVVIACDETTTPALLERVWAAFGVTAKAAEVDAVAATALPNALRRATPYLEHPVFHEHRSETAMMRYLRRLADLDVALDRSAIPLGSCTMKLNAATEMEPISWPGFARMHPFVPDDQAGGYHELIGDLERWLAEITGYDAVSLQPNAGSQGEFAGLLAVREYHRANGEPGRDLCLIPSSAHGTNAASAAMAGFSVVVVACDDRGDVDLDDLRAKVAANGNRVAVAMVTYPSTHGVFEEGITELCAIVHAAGGQVYVDGANLNALVGLARLGEIGADVSHLNLHKTFCIPHGGGGPGVGPVAAKAHLAPYLPGRGGGPVAAAPFGSAGILPISWAYIRMMGADGLAEASKVAILSANYVAERLGDRYPILYRGRKGLVAHECIVDLRAITKATGVTAEDVAKRLIDYGFHAPTMSFPVAGTLMIEPTESEDLAELDRFCDALLAIRDEIDRVATGELPKDDNPLRNAPHTAEMLTRDWPHPYTPEEAVYPPTVARQAKYWPPVRRIDSAYGDRNLLCTCPPIAAFAANV